MREGGSMSGHQKLHGEWRPAPAMARPGWWMTAVSVAATALGAAAVVGAMVHHDATVLSTGVMTGLVIGGVMLGAMRGMGGEDGRVLVRRLSLAFVGLGVAATIAGIALGGSLLGSDIGMTPSSFIVEVGAILVSGGCVGRTVSASFRHRDEVG